MNAAGDKLISTDHSDGVMVVSAPRALDVDVSQTQRTEVSAPTGATVLTSRENPMLVTITPGYRQAEPHPQYMEVVSPRRSQGEIIVSQEIPENVVVTSTTTGYGKVEVVQTESSETVEPVEVDVNYASLSREQAAAQAAKLELAGFSKNADERSQVTTTVRDSGPEVVDLRSGPEVLDLRRQSDVARGKGVQLMAPGSEMVTVTRTNEEYVRVRPRSVQESIAVQTDPEMSESSTDPEYVIQPKIGAMHAALVTAHSGQATNSIQAQDARGVVTTTSTERVVQPPTGSMHAALVAAHSGETAERVHGQRTVTTERTTEYAVQPPTASVRAAHIAAPSGDLAEHVHTQNTVLTTTERVVQPQAGPVHAALVAAHSGEYVNQEMIVERVQAPSTEAVITTNERVVQPQSGSVRAALVATHSAPTVQAQNAETVTTTTVRTTEHVVQPQSGGVRAALVDTHSGQTARQLQAGAGQEAVTLVSTRTTTEHPTQPQVRAALVEAHRGTTEYAVQPQSAGVRAALVDTHSGQTARQLQAGAGQEAVTLVTTRTTTEYPTQPQVRAALVEAHSGTTEYAVQPQSAGVRAALVDTHSGQTARQLQAGAGQEAVTLVTTRTTTEHPTQPPVRAALVEAHSGTTEYVVQPQSGSVRAALVETHSGQTARQLQAGAGQEAVTLVTTRTTTEHPTQPPVRAALVEAHSGTREYVVQPQSAGVRAALVDTHSGQTARQLQAGTGQEAVTLVTTRTTTEHHTQPPVRAALVEAHSGTAVTRPIPAVRKEYVVAAAPAEYDRVQNVDVRNTNAQVVIPQASARGHVVARQGEIVRGQTTSGGIVVHQRRSKGPAPRPNLDYRRASAPAATGLTIAHPTHEAPPNEESGVVLISSTYSQKEIAPVIRTERVTSAPRGTSEVLETKSYKVNITNLNFGSEKGKCFAFWVKEKEKSPLTK